MVSNNQQTADLSGLHNQPGHSGTYSAGTSLTLSWLMLQSAGFPQRLENENGHGKVMEDDNIGQKS